MSYTDKSGAIYKITKIRINLMSIAQMV